MVYIIVINQNIIKIYNDKNILLLGQNFVEITLKASQSVRQAK